MSSKAEERWKRLAAIGAKREIPTPDGEARMSAVILEVAEPLIKQYATKPERAETVIMLVVFGWNKSLFPPDKQAVVEKEILDQLVPQDGSGEAIGMAIHIMDTVAERRLAMFPDLRKVIVDHKVEIVRGNLTLNVTSAAVPEVD
jgi:hypothetical protein